MRKEKKRGIQFRLPKEVKPPKTPQEAYELGVLAGKLAKKGIYPLSIEGMAEAFDEAYGIKRKKKPIKGGQNGT